jgi:hypothetical protein
MDSGMPYNGLFARTIAAPKMNALDGATLERVSCNKNLRVVGESRGNIFKVLKVFIERVVRLKVRHVRKIRRDARTFYSSC